MLELDAKIEAILFWRAEPVSIKKLAEILKVPEGEIRDSLKILESKLTGRCTVLVEKDDEVMLGTNPSISALIEQLTKEELNKDIGKAGLETLSIILYYGPIARRDIDYIRGVNSSFIVRNLLVRGLIEKVVNKEDQRSFLYKPTFDLMSHLGLEKLENLPEYSAVRTELESFNKTAEEKNQEEQT